jgi:hypothetical protein
MKRQPAWRKALPEPAVGRANMRIYAKRDVGGHSVFETVLDLEVSSTAAEDIIRRARLEVARQAARLHAAKPIDK